jgi:methyl-accepting chemotaxis protein
MNVFLLGQKCVRRCSLPTKIFIVAGLFLIPVVVLLSLLSSKYDETIYFTQSEIQGLTVIHSMQEVWLLSRQHRRLIQKKINADHSGDQELAKIEKELPEKWEKSKLMIKQKIAKDAKQEDRFSDVDDGIKRILDKNKEVSGEESIRQHSSLINDIQDFIMVVADSSQLVLDPELDSYYVMDAAVQRIPEIAEYLAQIRFIGSAILKDKSITEDQKIKLVMQRELLKKDSYALLSAFGKSGAANPEVKKIFSGSSQKLKEEIDNVLAIVNNQLLIPNEEIKKSKITGKEYAQGISVSLDMATDLMKRSNNELMNLLELRLNKKINDKQLVLLLVAGMLLLSLYLFFAIRAIVSKDIKHICQAAEALSNGQFDHDTTIYNRDEIWMIHNAIQKVRTSIIAVVSDVQAFSEAGQSGNLVYRADESKHIGGYKNLVSGLNKSFDAIVEPFNLTINYVDNIARGVLPSDIRMDYKGDYKRLMISLETSVNAIRRVVKDVNFLVQSLGKGDLNVRADERLHQGEFATIISGVNCALETVAKPIHLSIEYVDSIAKGILPSPISNAYQGDFYRLTNSLNTSIGAIKRVVEDVNHLVLALQKGDLSTKAEASLHQGEFAAIIMGVNQALETVSLPINEVGKIFGLLAQGDLRYTVESHYEGKFAELSNSANTTVTRLREMVGQLVSTINEISTASNQILAGNMDLSHRTEEQSSHLEKTASSMLALTQTVKENAENARQAQQLALNASLVAEDGQGSVARVMKIMNDINQSSTRIYEIISVIDGIAFQTNILALNAAVEAARAGEQGKGFAVVAAEVRSLAQRSAQAAKEIKHLISESVDRVRAGNEVVSEAGLTMNEITASSKQVAEIITHISTASIEQSSGIQAISMSIEKMDDSTHQNTQLVQEVASAAGGLVDQSKHLEEMVKVFHLNNAVDEVPFEEEIELSIDLDEKIAESDTYAFIPKTIAHEHVIMAL